MTLNFVSYKLMTKLAPLSLESLYPFKETQSKSVYTGWAKSRYRVILYYTIYCIPTFGPPCIYMYMCVCVLFLPEYNCISIPTLCLSSSFLHRMPDPFKSFVPDTLRQFILHCYQWKHTHTHTQICICHNNLLSTMTFTNVSSVEAEH